MSRHLAGTSQSPVVSVPVEAPAFRDPQVVLFSTDVERAARFYGSLGFVERFRTSSQGEPIHVDVELGGYRIGIASIASTRDDHGLHPVEQGERAAVVLWTDDRARRARSAAISGRRRAQRTRAVARSAAHRLGR